MKCCRVSHFMEVKPIDINGLKQCVPEPWWESDEIEKEKSIEYDKKKQSYLANCQTIKNKTLGNFLF